MHAIRFLLYIDIWLNTVNDEFLITTPLIVTDNKDSQNFYQIINQMTQQILQLLL